MPTLYLAIKARSLGIVAQLATKGVDIDVKDIYI
jgi:hypothetical protein